MKLFILLTIFLYTLKNGETSPSQFREDNSTLSSVLVIYRHGDRTEKESYPKDPNYDIKHWPEGFGTFLNKGKVRTYNLGVWLRKRYNSFLSPKYNKSEIKVYSADGDVCLMSAECNLAGLYQVEKKDEWISDLRWDPVPIHTTPQEMDTVGAMGAPCAKYDKLFEQIKKDEYFVNIAKKNAEFFKFLTEKTGWVFEDIEYVRALYSVIYVTNEYNKNLLPEWLKDINRTRFTELAGLAWARETFTPELKRLRTGRFFETLFGVLDSVIAGKDIQKFEMLSTSIKVMTSVLNTMGVFDNHPIEFAATLIFELYKGPQNEHFLKLYHKKSYAPELEPLKLKGCPDYACDYNTVKELLSNYIVTQDTWEKECKE